MPGGDIALNNTGVGRPVIVDKKGKLKALLKGDIYKEMTGKMTGRRPVRVVETLSGCVICLGELWRNFLQESTPPLQVAGATHGRAVVPAGDRVLHGEILDPEPS